VVEAWKEALDGGLVHMRKNTDYLKHLSDYLDGTLTRKFPQMELFEEALIRNYTFPGGYYNVNAALRGDIAMTDELAEYAASLKTALDKLPNNSGTRFRGVVPDEGQILKDLPINGAYTSKGFYSVSYEEEIANIFRERNGGDVLVIVKTNSAKDITSVSSASWEGELLHNSNINWRKLSETQTVDAVTSEPITEIVLEQIN